MLHFSSTSSQTERFNTVPLYDVISSASIRAIGRIFTRSVRIFIIPGLTKPLAHKELLRRVHLLNDQILPKGLLDKITPTQAEMKDNYELVSDKSYWQVKESTSACVVVNVHLSSDGVRPQKTEKSSVRAVMGSISSFYSPELDIDIPVPDSTPFLIGVYKGKNKESDDVLRPLVAEVIALRPPPLREHTEVITILMKS
jgi:hypothetical protein